MINIINTKVILSGATILAAVALITGGTFAFFSDSVTSNDNEFTTGIMDLEIRDDNEGFSSTVTASTVALNMVPGGAKTESYVCFRNTGDYEIQEIILTMTATGNVDLLAPYVNATKVELGAVSPGECGEFDGGSLTDFTALYESRFDTDTSGDVSLKESLDQVNGDDRTNDDLLDGAGALLPADPSVLLKFRTTWQLDADAPNSAQGKSVLVDTTFVGNQDEL